MQTIETRVVGEGQYGIIAPRLDSNGVNRLVTVRMNECFGISVSDSRTEVGFFTHLAFPNDISKVTPRILHLKEYGVRRVRVGAVNLYSNIIPEDMQRNEHNLQFKNLIILIARLYMNGFIVEGFGWRNIGRANKAALDCERGLYRISTDDLLDGVSKEEEQRYGESVRLRHISVLEAESFEARKLLPITCAYQPQILTA